MASRNFTGDESAILEGHVLNIAFRSPAPFATVVLEPEDGGEARLSLLLLDADIRRSTVDLRRCPPGVYRILLRPAHGEDIAFGRHLIERQSDMADAGELRTIARSKFTDDRGHRFATVYAHPATKSVLLRLAELDDEDAFSNSAQRNNAALLHHCPDLRCREIP